jgi:hypothetical protein
MSQAPKANGLNRARIRAIYALFLLVSIYLVIANLGMSIESFERAQGNVWGLLAVFFLIANVILLIGISALTRKVYESRLSIERFILYVSTAAIVPLVSFLVMFQNWWDIFHSD